ncbi:g5572 [Coccomyxa elongata]
MERQDHTTFEQQEAVPREPLIQVAERAGVHIETGCNTGSCGICEVEVRKVQAGGVLSSIEAPAVVRACIVKIPPGYERVEVCQLSDSIWGSDGWDTST